VNFPAVRLLFAFLWLVPGLGFLAVDLATGESHSFRVLGRNVPIYAVAIPLGLLNLSTWYRTRGKPVEPIWLRRRRPDPQRPPGEPDPNFRFDPPAGVDPPPSI
jgi:hypothetical protein